jgi:hypothetical protein
MNQFRQGTASAVPNSVTDSRVSTPEARGTAVQRLMRSELAIRCPHEFAPTASAIRD